MTGYFVPDTTGATYVSLAPARILDTRNGTGLSGTFTSTVPRSLQVTGVGGVPSGAIAVTGNLTVTEPDEPRLRRAHHGLHPGPSTSPPSTSRSGTTGPTG